ncbi:hypothetical protein wVul_0736 [Wolbachia endosymbiont of Armadillidium vulgare str. wVulC]|uniref:hypothetical protein n=1 Tax=Wolbachia endosymbiont of Armadillidium vulgare TaxID=77039 RepID=UPI00064A4F34|nr:hypothetical protein [Wolbachia endosymbiont of Armadillidium vulgare]KLT22729.1 hypothetical protein wVul_0736 [Wolbachia endosymbiont of Armadillidium vulgare str. wVulC]OJH31787.1 hypothetical protein Wxf_01193 [Wolbachia endosymbiont of Armadillidium vulgare]OJH32695.1 hypothetical protein Wxf_02144 [Wolbachia endosymbiont of Armadillidium vulgare]OJH33317.1 hypothetical protein Wxf_02798 [Wolbachia endosymbiont of Armadillidium vulgare]
MSSLYSNFKGYAKLGITPTKSVVGNEVPKNSFYKSVHLINSVVGPVKNVAFGNLLISSVTYNIAFTLANVVLQPLYLALAYLSYWPTKGLAKATDNFNLKNNTKSLIDYSCMLSNKAWGHSRLLANFVNTVLSYAVSAVIWAAALVVTPLIWAVDKVASKFSDAKTEDVGNSHLLEGI